MSDFRFGCEGRFSGSSREPDSFGEHLGEEEDLRMEQILENIKHTPIGKVLQKISSLPEVRQEKVLDVRRRLNEGHYSVSERLDVALDKVLEDLTA